MSTNATTFEHLETAEKWAALLFTLSPTLVVFGFCLACGYLLRGLPHFRNRYIPHASVVIGTVLLPLIVPRTAVTQSVQSAWLYLALLGFLVGFAAWLGHCLGIKRVEDWAVTKFPRLREFLETTSDDTNFLMKAGAEGIGGKGGQDDRMDKVDKVDGVDKVESKESEKT